MSSKRMFTTGEVAGRLGVPRWRLQYLVERGVVPGPSQQVPGRRLFSEEDVTNLRAVFQHLKHANRRE